MRPMILIFNLLEEKLGKLRFTCMRLGIQVRPVEQNQQGQTIAALCGMMDPADAPAPDAPFTESLLVMANFNQSLANKLLAALKQAKLSIPLKAVVTPTNALWTADHLYQELTAERAAIQQGMKADHREFTVAPGESLQAAIDALPKDGSPAVLRLAPGTYREKIALTRPHTTLLGGDPASTCITWDDGAKTILEDGMKRGTFRTATLLVDAPHVTLRGLTIENAAAPREAVGQAIALYADGDHFTCEDCILRSKQDTLFTAPLPPKEIEKNGFIGPKQFAPRTPQRHTYRCCRIEGDVDFIFGGAAAWFQDCDIVSVGEGYATAASTPEGQAFGYVFDHCRFLSEGIPDHTCYLGRPWRDWAKTILLHCQIGPHIKPEAWHDWGKPAFHTCGYYGEYPGTGAPRADYAHVLTEEEAEEITYEAFMASMPET